MNQLARYSEQLEKVHSALQSLPGDRCYSFGLLMLERLAALAEAMYPSGLPPASVPYDEIQTGLARLWGRVPDGPPDLNLALTSTRWQPDERDHQPLALPSTLAFYTGRFCQVNLRWPIAAAAESVDLLTGMSSVLYGEAQDREFEEESLDLITLQGGEPDLAALRTRAREAGRGFADLLGR